MKKKKYNSIKYKNWYQKNKDRIRESKRKAKKKYRKTALGRAANRRYMKKPQRRKYIWERNLKLRYKMTPKEYDEMAEKQDNSCLICNRETLGKLHIDHDHNTGKVRGLLCGSCNRGLGMFGDDPEILSRAIKYLKK